MGMPMSIDIRDAGDWSEAATAAFAVMQDADRRFSTFRTDSEVSAVNRGELDESEYSDDLRDVLAIGDAACVASGGAFRVRTPGGGLDTDGVVKGWAAARAAAELRRRGIRAFCLNAAGDVVVEGAPEPASAWNVGVRSPDDPAAMLAVLAVTDCSVATSGAYERGQHIVDARTGSAARSLVSVTVIADDLTTADVLATTVFALGREGVGWAVEHGARGVLALTVGGELLATGELPLATP